MLKLLYTLLTDPLGLPIDSVWEYIILLAIGEIGHEIAWYVSPGGRFGSLIYWGTKLIAFVAIWAILYVVIAAVKFIIAYWVWFAIGTAVLIITAITTWWLWKRKTINEQKTNSHR